MLSRLSALTILYRSGTITARSFRKFCFHSYVGNFCTTWLSKITAGAKSSLKVWNVCIFAWGTSQNTKAVSWDSIPKHRHPRFVVANFEIATMITGYVVVFYFFLLLLDQPLPDETCPYQVTKKDVSWQAHHWTPLLKRDFDSRGWVSCWFAGYDSSSSLQRNSWGCFRWLQRPVNLEETTSEPEDDKSQSNWTSIDQGEEIYICV